ncbi:MAG: hypothetical protein ABIF11_11550 [Nitrospirota bacterium]
MKKLTFGVFYGSQTLEIIRVEIGKMGFFHTFSVIGGEYGKMYQQDSRC